MGISVKRRHYLRTLQTDALFVILSSSPVVDMSEIVLCSALYQYVLTSYRLHENMCNKYWRKKAKVHVHILYFCIHTWIRARIHRQNEFQHGLFNTIINTDIQILALIPRYQFANIIFAVCIKNTRWNLNSRSYYN